MSHAIAYPARPRSDGLRHCVLMLLLAASALSGIRHASGEGNGVATDDSNATAIFAGGCFWCLESDFDKVPGVLSTTSGYTGGTLANPTYEQVSSGGSGHLEALLVHFDPAQTNYAKLLAAYWPNIDPLTAIGQFCDIGSQYRSAIFYRTPEQQRLAEASKSALQASGRFAQPIVTEILPAGEFYPAEAYHQDYYQKNPLRYFYYRTTCRRDARLKALWGEHR